MFALRASSALEAALSTAHRQQQIASLDLARASDIEREANKLVERVDRRLLKLREQRLGSASLASPPAGSEAGGPSAAVVEPLWQPLRG